MLSTCPVPCSTLQRSPSQLPSSTSEPSCETPAAQPSPPCTDCGETPGSSWAGGKLCPSIPPHSGPDSLPRFCPGPVAPGSPAWLDVQTFVLLPRAVEDKTLGIWGRKGAGSGVNIVNDIFRQPKVLSANIPPALIIIPILQMGKLRHGLSQRPISPHTDSLAGFLMCVPAPLSGSPVHTRPCVHVHAPLFWTPPEANESLVQIPSVLFWIPAPWLHSLSGNPALLVLDLAARFWIPGCTHAPLF